jgi:hypothetical protein
LTTRRRCLINTIVFRRVGHLLLIIALVSATGAHWAALQSFAWAAMLADNARITSLPVAIERTFDGKHPCALCRRIAQERQNEKKSDFQSEAKKLEFLNESVVLYTSPSARFVPPTDAVDIASLLTRTPPVPPPRIPAA